MTTKNYTARVAKLRERRQGGGLYKSANESYVGAAADAADIVEAYEKRAQSHSLQYALGAMQEVEKRYTVISHEQGERVSSQISEGMKRRDQRVDVHLQGSLPLNIHLRRYSDVDLLVFPASFWMYDSNGPAAATYTPSTKDRIEVVKGVRKDCFEILRAGFPQADVDNDGAKCITISGGSLSRSVDVVPALWFDTVAYQTSRDQRDRGVNILDLPAGKLSQNFPFIYMAKINEKDSLTDGGAKKAIRLLKTLKYDADIEVKLSSFDIASLVWNASIDTLKFPSYLEPALLASLQVFLNSLCRDRALADSLSVADGTRKIIRSDNDYAALHALNGELTDLIESIAVEMKPKEISTIDRARSVLLEARVY
ncbi:conserved hypothetical protein [Cupriavidus taiwanensis]|uniref:hypothetical protein n=1 Tax=Cupriavidus taiwanensis TaxID=164546 RepID=UPI000E1A8CB9|nr:hypothetical protein [Cupriavidus taiwanensis]SPA26713.1 conserved hypothetical protein [Cupriavidus taiwanensis]